MVVVASTHRHGRSSPRSPEYFDTGEQQVEREREVTMTQPAAYARYSQRVWTNAKLAKDFLKVKTYSDLIVLKQDAHDKLGRRFSVYPFRVYRALHSHGIYGKLRRRFRV